MDTKVCSKCKVEKPLSEFHRSPSTQDGHTYCCKSCRQVYNRAYTSSCKELHERAEMLIAFRTLKHDIKKVAGKE